jgi:hypothetical protein
MTLPGKVWVEIGDLLLDVSQHAVLPVAEDGVEVGHAARSLLALRMARYSGPVISTASAISLPV